MPNATQNFWGQQVLEQLTPKLLDPIPKRKMYKQSQQTTVACTALYKNEIKFFAPYEIRNVIYRYTKHIFFIYGLRQITHDINVLKLVLCHLQQKPCPTQPKKFLTKKFLTPNRT